jgi:hypothetical protein
MVNNTPLIIIGVLFVLCIISSVVVVLNEQWFAEVKSWFGISGTSGPTGSPGTTLISGPTGSPGTTLISGPTGSPGTTLISGPTGSPGTTLISGPTGSPGTTLISGPTGSPGTTLISVPTGSPLGSPLISGPTGSPGTRVISPSLLVGNRYNYNNSLNEYLLFVSETNVELWTFIGSFRKRADSINIVNERLEVSYNGSMVTIRYYNDNMAIIITDTYSIDSNGNLIAQGTSRPLTIDYYQYIQGKRYRTGSTTLEFLPNGSVKIDDIIYGNTYKIVGDLLTYTAAPWFSIYINSKINPDGTFMKPSDEINFVSLVLISPIDYYQYIQGKIYRLENYTLEFLPKGFVKVNNSITGHTYKIVGDFLVSYLDDSTSIRNEINPDGTFRLNSPELISGPTGSPGTSGVSGSGIVDSNYWFSILNRYNYTYKMMYGTYGTVFTFNFLSTTTYSWVSENQQGISSCIIFDDGTLILENPQLPRNTVFKTSITGDITTVDRFFSIIKNLKT